MTDTTATTSDPPEPELTARQAAAEFGVPQRVFQYAAQRGLIPNRRVGNAYLLNRSGCAAYATAYRSRRRDRAAS
ncbi:MULTISPECIES: hypothetical protein [Mycolicibacterium]|uniref:Excise n=1 Tax=Mycobacterium phage Bipper TaxID=1805457 RepID=A0A142F2I0_9CAUD|nr:MULTISPECIES: hypothetical protein [Mycolicibacterium]YP_009303199.1 recombination directionality factor [Mycobacterium phage Bipper]QDF19338.1 excise [Mycobacterium phage Cracklewink]AMQ66987.1 excise [Mycobacterium phage Bipper]MCC9181172.1 hypothetical protein [Mycolicibacterium mageritense]UBV14873.1 hypothetical protein H8Z57_29985 [Mycolicibacterium fortuitum]